MEKSLWLQYEQGEACYRVDEPADLFIDCKFNLLHHDGLSRAEVDANVNAGINVEAGVDAAGGESLRRLASPQLAASNDQPVVMLQELSADDYCLQRETINAGLQRYRQLSQPMMEQRWLAARLRIDAGLPDERLYFVQCIDLSLLCWCRVDTGLKPMGATHVVLRDDQGMITHNEQELSELTLRALETSATRALYAIGLDIGSVLVAVSGTGSMAIRKVWSIEHNGQREQQPSELPFEREALNRAMQQWLECWQPDSNQPFLLGADPELLFVDQHHKLVSASELLLDHMSEQIGMDALLYKKRLIYPIVELRPHPVQNPAQLIAALRRLLGQLHELVAGRPLRLLAGGMPVAGVALGGHLHISGIPLTPRLLRMLDIMLAVPFAALADERGKARNLKFGGLGDYRKQFHGGFEYRTLPSWLVSPALTKAAIYTCWVTISERFTLAHSLENVLEVNEAYIRSGQMELYTLAEKQIAQLISLANDRLLAEKLKPLLRALQRRVTWDERQDIRERWQLMSATETGGT